MVLREVRGRLGQGRGTWHSSFESDWTVWTVLLAQNKDELISLGFSCSERLSSPGLTLERAILD